MKPFIPFALLLSTAFAGQAQLTDKIVTDRPDQTETPFIVPQKYFQAEFGFNTESFHNGVSRFLHPTGLLKYGLNKRMELRLETNYLSRELKLIPQPITTTLLEPVEIGTKVRLFEEKGALPKTSVIVQAGLPFVASKEFRSEPVPYSARLAMENSLSHTISIGYNIGVEGGGDDETTFLYTFTTGFDMGDKWHSYVEVYGNISGKDAAHNIDTGLVYTLSANTQLDLSAGFGLGNSELKHYIAAGFSFRIPSKKH